MKQERKRCANDYTGRKEKTMENTALKNLLAINRKALQGLHAIGHMDFTQPYTLIEKHGKFTYKSVMNDLGNIDTRDYNIYLIYAETDTDTIGRKRTSSYLVEIYNGDFHVDRDTIINYRTAYGWRYFHEINMKKTFERYRKNPEGHYFIIAQEREAENYRAKSIPLAGRFRVSHECSYTRVLPYDRNGDWYYNNVSGVVGTIDKSGYSTEINNYPDRLKEIRRKKSQEQAKAWNGSAIFKAFESRLNTVRTVLGNLLATTAECDYKAIAEAARQLGYAADAIGNFNKEKYSDMSQIEMRLRWINEYIEKAEKAIA